MPVERPQALSALSPEQRAAVDAFVSLLRTGQIHPQASGQLSTTVQPSINSSTLPETTVSDDKDDPFGDPFTVLFAGMIAGAVYPDMTSRFLNTFSRYKYLQIHFMARIFYEIVIIYDAASILTHDISNGDHLERIFQLAIQRAKKYFEISGLDQQEQPFSQKTKPGNG